MLKGMLNETVDLPSGTYASCGETAEKSAPGFAVPDSVHQVKLVSPRKLPLRCTVTWADGWPAGTSTVSAANSSFDVPVGALAAGATSAGLTAGAAAGDELRGGDALRDIAVAGVAADAIGAAAVVALCDADAEFCGAAATVGALSAGRALLPGRVLLAGGEWLSWGELLAAGVLGAEAAVGAAAVEVADDGAGVVGAGAVDAVDSMLGSMARWVINQ